LKRRSCAVKEEKRGKLIAERRGKERRRGQHIISLPNMGTARKKEEKKTIPRLLSIELSMEESGGKRSEEDLAPATEKKGHHPLYI